MRYDTSGVQAMLRQLRAKDAVRYRLNAKSGFLISLLLAVFLLRMSSSSEVTLSVEESVNVETGSTALHEFPDSFAGTDDNSNLFPMLLAVVVKAGGMVGLRLLLASLNTITVLFVYLVTQRVFGLSAGLWSIIFYGFMEASISMGQLAFPDALSLPFFAASLFMILNTADNSDEYSLAWPMVSGLLAAIATLTKYTVIFYIPALFWVAILYYVHKRLHLKHLLTFPVVYLVILAGYFLAFSDQIGQVITDFEEGFSFLEPSFSGRDTITVDVILVLLVAMAGVGHIVYRIGKSQNLSMPRRWFLIVQILVLGILVVGVPVYGTTSTLWTNILYSAVFLAPVAAYTMTTITTAPSIHLTPKMIALRGLGMVLTVAFLFTFLTTGIDRSWGRMHSWPNVTETITFLEDSELGQDDSILAEDAPIYKIHFDMISENNVRWTNISSFSNAQELEAQIVRESYDLIIVDNYVTAEGNELPSQVLLGYTPVFQSSLQLLSNNQSITITVYEREDERP